MPTNPRLKFHNRIARDPVTGLYHARRKVRGKPRQLAFPTRKAALAWLEHLALDDAGVELATAGPTLEEASESYLASRRRLNRRPRTFDYYRVKYAALKKGLGNPRLDRIRQSDIDAYVDARLEDVCGGTVNKEIADLATLYKHSRLRPRWRYEEISHNAAERPVYDPPIARTLWHALPSDEVRAAVGLCLFCGLRGEEAPRVLRGGIEGDTLRLDPAATKTGSAGRTYLVPTLRAVLPTGGDPARPIITLSESEIRAALADASRAAGIDPPIEGIGHFRHFCTTYADECGWSELEIRQVTRHSTRSTTKRYIHSQSIRLKQRLLLDVEAYFLGTWTEPER